MPQRVILEHPNEQLRQTSSPVTNFDASLAALVDDLIDTLGEQGGIGLSAPQLGDLRQVMVIHVPGDEFGEQTYINPEILWSQRPGLVEESCLSVPGIVGNVIRATRLRVRACDLQGETFEREVDGMHAVCLQHEQDHLRGKLFIDRLSWFRRLRMRWTDKRTARAARQQLPLGDPG